MKVSARSELSRFGVSGLLPAVRTYHGNLRSGNDSRLYFECFSRISVAVQPGQLASGINDLVKKVMRGPVKLITQNLCMLFLSTEGLVKEGDTEGFISPYPPGKDLPKYVERLQRYGAKIFAGLNQHIINSLAVPGANTHARAMLSIQYFIDSEIGEALLFFRGEAPSCKDEDAYNHFRVSTTPIAVLVVNLNFDKFFWNHIPEDQRNIILDTLNYLVAHNCLKKEALSSFLAKVNDKT